MRLRECEFWRSRRSVRKRVACEHYCNIIYKAERKRCLAKLPKPYCNLYFKLPKRQSFPPKNFFFLRSLKLVSNSVNVPKILLQKWTPRNLMIYYYWTVNFPNYNWLECSKIMRRQNKSNCENFFFLSISNHLHYFRASLNYFWITKTFLRIQK